MMRLAYDNQPASDPLRVLLVEDNEHDRFAFSRALGKNAGQFQMDACERGEDAIDWLAADPNRIQVVVVDHDLPGITGLDVFTELKKRFGEAYLPPFVMLTGAGTEDLASTAIKAGIYDYLVKDPQNRYLSLLPTILVNVHRRYEQHMAYLEAQRQLARAHRELEAQVQARTRELSQTVKVLREEVGERMKVETALRRARQRLQDLSTRVLETQETERKVIAQELHDSIGGNLAAIKMSLETRIEKMGDFNAEEGFSLERIVGHIKDLITEVRRITARLRPKDLDSLGLLGAIRGACRQSERQYQGIRIGQSLHVEETQIDESLKLVVYRIFQEALANAARHASAENIRVALAANDGRLELTVEDDGNGFDLQEGMEKGNYGLKNMHDRAELSGGVLRLESAPGAGTRVSAVFSLKGMEDRWSASCERAKTPGDVQRAPMADTT
jgi:signal transduction histidine kinase